MFDMTPDVVLNQFVGLVGFGLGCYAFTEKCSNRFKLKLGMFNLVMIAHFLLIGAITSAGVALFAAMRTFVSAYTKSTKVMLAFMTAILVMGFITLSSQAELLTLFGTIIATYALFKLKGVMMRVCILCNSLCWLLNNIILGSIGGVGAELTFVIINFVTVCKLLGVPHSEVSSTQSKSA
ncbi:YgjV family protein [Vibrio sp. WXL103]|uniref:YgjV family protein n=1 Tax=Vibrio sp. WXL103 TaxID=3450710 RepID=UPI003EC65C15